MNQAVACELLVLLVLRRTEVVSVSYIRLRCRSVLFFWGIVVSFCYGASLSVEDAVTRATLWMADNPIMSVVTNCVVASVDVFPEEGSHPVYVVHLEPTGYVVLNSDDRFPLVVSYSADSIVDLSSDTQNAFCAMLLQHVEKVEEALLQPESESSVPTLPEARSTRETTEYGPFLDTLWAQNNPYNRQCPVVSSSYVRAPSGCAQTAFAQLMRFYCWPYCGQGSHTYTDSLGDFTGTYSAVFSDRYEWGNMRSSYSNASSSSEKDAVAEVMYELGVAAEANYESDITSSSIVSAVDSLVEYFYFEANANYYQYSLASIEADLRSGRPVVGAIPGHAIVVDGLMIKNGVKTYHINYGWGGPNNGWWAIDAVPGGSLTLGVTSLRPRLLAFSRSNQEVAAAGKSVDLEWVLPVKRTNEIDHLEILRRVPKNGLWQSDGSQIVGDNLGWTVVSADETGGDCWFADGGNSLSQLVLGEVFVPAQWSRLLFQYNADLTARSRFAVEVSTDGGQSFKEIAPVEPMRENGWFRAVYLLMDYAGQKIQLRFYLSSPDGTERQWSGMRIDNLVFETDQQWYGWEPFAVDSALKVRAPEEVIDPALAGVPVYFSTITNLAPGTYTFAAIVVDANNVSHGMCGQPVVLTVKSDDEDGDGMPSYWEELYGLDINLDDGGLDPDFDGYSNYSEYLCGTDPTDAASRWMLVSETDGMPTFLGLSDRLYTIQCCTNLLEGAWLPLAVDIPGSNAVISVRDYDTAGQNVRYYRVQVRVPN
jgi:hypothetical protein